MAKLKQAKQQHIVYVVAFGPSLTKVGRTRDWTARRKALTHHGGFAVVSEAIFHIDPADDLNDVEQVVLERVRDAYRNAGGKEWFKASFDEVLPVVTQALASGGVDAELVIPDAPEGERAADLSEMSGEQLDRSIYRFAAEHGIPTTRIVRWLGVSGHSDVIRRTGYVPNVVADRVQLLWERPAALFERAIAL